MKDLSLLISPESRNAFFAEYIKLSQEELRLCLGSQAQHRSVGTLDFLDLQIEEEQLESLPRLSFLQGVFQRNSDGSLLPLPLEENFFHHPDLVFASKFKGKTNERLTQFMLNIAIAQTGLSAPKVLDPMCGRATTLLWALRYGLQAKGIEQDNRAITDIKQISKKWNKVHQEDLKFKDGFVGKKNKNGLGQFLEIHSKDAQAKVITGDSRDAESLLSKEGFDIILSDLPYGVQHHTSKGTRNPLDTLKETAPGWVRLLKQGGVLCLAFNSYLPKTKEMLDLFVAQGLESIPLDSAHRMSESIVREVILFRKV